MAAGAAKPAAVSNQRNGKGAKTALTENGPIRIEVPRDCDGSFAPLLIPKHERRFTGFDDKTVAMYVRGMPVRVMTYVGLLYQDLIRGGQVLTGGKLPPVLAIVLYNGGAIEKGMEEGLEKGIVKGIAKGEALVLQRLLTKRFGPLPADAVQAISTASTEQIGAWLDRLFEACSLDEALRP